MTGESKSGSAVSVSFACNGLSRQTNNLEMRPMHERDGFAELEKQVGSSPREERVIAGFEEIQRFVEEHGRAPQHGEGRDIFERLFAVRLDRLRALEECRSLLAPLDHQGLLAGAESALSR